MRVKPQTGLVPLYSCCSKTTGWACDIASRQFQSADGFIAGEDTALSKEAEVKGMTGMSKLHEEKGRQMSLGTGIE